MKLLFYRYGSICEPDIIQGFYELGHEIITCDDQITHPDRSISESVSLVSNLLLEHPVDFVFSINFFPFLSEVCNIFHLRYLSWTVDSPVMELYSAAISNDWNRMFLFDKAQYEEFSHYNLAHIFHLPLAANVSNKELLFKQTPNSMHQKFAHDIAFVGSLYTEKCPYDKLINPPAYLKGYLDAIMASQEKIYGYYFISDLLSDTIIDAFKEHLPNFYEYPGKSYLTDRETLSQLYIGNKITALERLHTMEALTAIHPVDIYTGSDTNSFMNLTNHGFANSVTEMPLIFHNAGINLNTTSKAIRSGLPQRIFDILSCGGFVLTNYQSELADLFHPGEDLAVYGSLDELQELSVYYLSHDKLRSEMAMAGLDPLKEHHSYELRLATMIVKAFEA